MIERCRIEIRRTPMHSAPLKLHYKTRDDWHAGLQQHLLPVDCSVENACSFQCSAIFSQLNGNTVAELRADESRIVRRAIDISVSSGDLVKVFWQLAGRSRIEQGSVRSMLEAGTWTICDPGREYAIELDKGANFLLMLVPRAQCPGWVPAMSVLSARALPTVGPAYIASAALVAMLRDSVLLDAGSQAPLHDAVVLLVERALALALESRGLEAEAEKCPRLAQVQTYILQHLSDRTLTVDKLATVFGVSRRSLYNVFMPSELTPHAFIQSARLGRACELLRRSNGRKATVAQVARQCGFADPAHFSRAFHARHGVPPTAWREGLS
jgi:AraC-like DNA-binding protein